MAEFIKAYKKLEVAEGGYVNNPNDKGGETYKGIARKYNPDWVGWSVVDDIKKHHPTTFKGILKATPQLEKYVQELYKIKYWNVLNLDNFKSQSIAEELFDTCVNCGRANAIKIVKKLVGKNNDCNTDSDYINFVSRLG